MAEDTEVDARLATARPCIVAQVRATRRGAPNPRPRDVVDGGSVAIRNLAMHDFDLIDISAVTPEVAKRRQRGGRSRTFAVGAVPAAATKGAASEAADSPAVLAAMHRDADNEGDKQQHKADAESLVGANNNGQSHGPRRGKMGPRRSQS